jgi:hypothetical protein
VTTTRSQAAAAARIGAALAARKRGELVGLLRPCFVRVEPWMQAGKYVAALAGGLPRRNGWTIAQQAGDPRRWEVRSAGQGSKGERWYVGVAGHRLPAASLADPPPPGQRGAGLSLLLCARRPAGEQGRLIRAAGLRWPVEESFEFGKDCFGLDQSQARLYGAIARHTVLVMAALAACAVAAAPAPRPHRYLAPPPVWADQPPPADQGMISLTVPEITRLLAASPLSRPLGHAKDWANWRRRHQARARWYHQRTRLTRDTVILLAWD